ncbi:MAG: hypothetical protein U0350_36260 [Caldilineaceae bacterium]
MNKRQHLEYVEMQAIDDLLNWEEENDCLLPGALSAEQIAELEARGLVVDLLTGEIMTEAEAEVRLWERM